MTKVRFTHELSKNQNLQPDFW